MIDSPNYLQAIDTWPDDRSIWDELESWRSKASFASYIIQGKMKSQTYIAESTTPVCAPFICEHFAQKRILEFGIGQLPDGSDSDYPFLRASPKFLMPMSFVSVAFPEGKRHAINGIFIGEKNADMRSKENWLFFEPQSNKILYYPGLNLSRLRGVGFHIVPTSTILSPLSREGRTDFNPQEFKDHIYFAVTPNGRLMEFPYLKLDGFGALNVEQSASEIISHSYAGVRTVVVGQRKIESRQQIVDAIKLLKTWPEEDLNSIILLVEFSDGMAKKYGQYENYRDSLLSLFHSLEMGGERTEQWASQNHGHPWFNDWVTFLAKERMTSCSTRLSKKRTSSLNAIE